MLKPQDIVLALKLLCKGKDDWSQGGLGMELVMSASEVNAGIKRLAFIKLIEKQEDGRKWQVIKPALKEFLLYGIKYVFPADKGAPTIGIPTANASDMLRHHAGNIDFPPVWPVKGGKIKGYSFAPLYPTVPLAVKNDPELYEWLCIVDALRDNENEILDVAELALNEKLAGRPLDYKKLAAKEVGKNINQMDLLS